MTNILFNFVINKFWSIFAYTLVHIYNNIIMAHLKYDNREKNMMFVDKANKHYAETNDIIKFILKPDKGDTKRFKVASFIGKSFGITGIALELYCIATTYYGDTKFTISNIINTYKRIYGVKGRNGSWYNAVNKLIEKNIFYKTDDNKYILFNAYKLPTNCNNAKFIIVEIDENDTSAPITI